jgi:hypothetical protein
MNDFEAKEIRDGNAQITAECDQTLTWLVDEIRSFDNGDGSRRDQLVVSRLVGVGLKDHRHFAREIASAPAHPQHLMLTIYRLGLAAVIQSYGEREIESDQTTYPTGEPK